MFKQFLMKQALKLKGIKGEQADKILDAFEKNPELAETFKKLEANKEVMDLLKKIQSEIEQKTKGGMDETMASMSVMMKYKKEVQEHQEELLPLMQLMQK